MDSKIHIKLLELFVALLASATIADQVTRIFSLNPNVLVVTWLLISFVVIRVSQSFRELPISQEFEASTQSPRRNALFASVFASLIFASLAASARTSTTYLLANIVCFFIVISASLFFLQQRSSEIISTQSDLVATKSTWVMAFMAAFFAAITFRPNTDDHYYVNLSTYIFEKGVIPTRDTVLSNQIYNSYPRITSWEVFVGAISRWLHTSPANLLYIIFVPLGTALSIFALAKLFEVSRTKNFSIAIICSSVFLITDGANGFTFGNFQGPRIWQGKSLFLAVLVPLLFAYVISLLQKFNNHDAWSLLLVVIAAVGATSTSLIFVPVLLAGAIFISIMRTTWKATGLFTLAFSYIALIAIIFHGMRTSKPNSIGALSPFSTGVGISTKSVSHSASTVMPSTFELLTAMAKPTWHAALFAFCITFGIWSLREKLTTLLITMTTLSWAIICLPGIHELVFKTLKAQAIGWRYMWLIPVPFLLGTSASQLVGLFPRFRKQVFASVLTLLVLLPGLFGYYPWQTIPGKLAPARLNQPVAQRVGFGFTLAWKAINQVAQPGDLILARNGIGASLAATTTLYYPVSPRDTYVRSAVGKFPNGFANERIELTSYVMPSTKTNLTAEELKQKLNQVRVQVVCLPVEQPDMILQFKELGYSAREFTQISKREPTVGFWCGRTDKFDN